RNRFWIAIHHDGFETILAQRESGMAAAIIEFNSLSDTIRPAAENHDFRPCLGVRLVFVFVCGIKVGRKRFKLRGASIHTLKNRCYAIPRALQTHRSRSCSPDLRQLLVAGAVPLYFA